MISTLANALHNNVRAIGCFFVVSLLLLAQQTIIPRISFDHLIQVGRNISAAMTEATGEASVSHNGSHQLTPGVTNSSNTNVTTDSTVLIELTTAGQVRLPDSFVTVNVTDGARLGNQMFRYAAMLGIGAVTNKSPILGLNYDKTVFPSIYEYFSPSLKTEAADLPKYMGGYDRSSCKFEESLMHLQPKQNYTLGLYLQSWKYFPTIFDELREKEFKFNNKTLSPCVRNMRRFDAFIEQGYILVGVHTRRGDFTLEGKMKFGHKPAKTTYIFNAFQYFRARFGKCLFLLFGDDPAWNLEHIHDQNLGHNDTIVMEMNSPGIDICTHTIATTGSFGWWAAFLANGHATFQKEWARYGSSHYNEYDPVAYFLPEAVLIEGC